VVCQSVHHGARTPIYGTLTFRHGSSPESSTTLQSSGPGASQWESKPCSVPGQAKTSAKVRKVENAESVERYIMNCSLLATVLAALSGISV